MHRLVFAIIGALAGLVVGFIIALARGREQPRRRLRLRDEIANSIGIPVLASLPVSRPSSAADWARLLSSYEPGPVYAWRLRKALQQLAVAGVHMTGGREDGQRILCGVSCPWPMTRVPSPWARSWRCSRHRLAYRPR